jgi:hypothetical protein
VSIDANRHGWRSGSLFGNVKPPLLICPSVQRLIDRPVLCAELERLADSRPMQWETADAAYSIQQGWLIGEGKPPHSICLTDAGCVWTDRPKVRRCRGGDKHVAASPANPFRDSADGLISGASSRGCHLHCTFKAVYETAESDNPIKSNFEKQFVGHRMDVLITDKPTAKVARQQAKRLGIV